ncbi:MULTISPECIES: OmpA family protein [Shewanella]|jgi:outer membrane protein OmpA-like peptidoglycan-associated protein|uniref:OmpA family protein n=1 Tax=Shewanella TaxID=22 RepID=UPI00200F9E6C|nr:OmpA family protein [Shewanella basaltis]MCL1112006.1 OmpA family protein [Shewanella basaltis]
MKYLMILLAMLTATGCSMNDIVELDKPTEQKFDLTDMDQDGVITARENCAGTILGAEVDNYGCGQVSDINNTQELKILFANNSDVIEQEYYSQIEKVAKILKKYPETKVVIEGHTSLRGSYELNLALSQKRAKAVIDVLENTFEIGEDRMSAVGYSFDKPIDTSGTPEGEVRNRRVIATVTGEDTMSKMRWTIYTVDDVDE